MSRRKNFMRWVLPIVMLMMIISSNMTFTVHAQEGKCVKVTTYSCCIRSTPSYIQDNICGWGQQGNTFPLLGETEKFYRISFKGNEAFLSKTTAAIINDAPASTPPVNKEDDSSKQPQTGNAFISCTGTVTGANRFGKLRVRALPKASSKELGRLSDGDNVNIITKMSNGWYKVQYKDFSEAYVCGIYIKVNSQVSSKENTNPKVPAEESTNPKAFSGFAEVINVNNTYLNLRIDRSTSKPRISEINSGAIVKVLEDPNKVTSSFIKVEANGLEGFVCKSYLKFLSVQEYDALPKGETLRENVIAEWTTRIYNTNAGSRYNMKKAAGFINGTVLKPDESLGFYSKTHPSGFLYEFGGIFINGGSGSARGGGICQVSTTMHGALVNAKKAGVDTGINITARRPHGQDVLYAEKFQEATIIDSARSFEIRNVNDYPVKIEVSCDLDKNIIRVQYLKVS